MKKEIKTGMCWSCGDKGVVIFTTKKDAGFVCLECAVKKELIPPKCASCEWVHDCRRIAEGQQYVCDGSNPNHEPYTDMPTYMEDMYSFYLDK